MRRLTLLLAVLSLSGGAAAQTQAEGWRAIAPSASSVERKLTLVDLDTRVATNYDDANLTYFKFGRLGIAISRDGDRAYVVSATSQALLVYDISGTTPVPLSATALPAGARELALSPDGSKVAISLQSTDQVLPVDVTGPTPVLGTPIAVGDAPEGLAFAPDGHTIYAVGSGDGTVTPIVDGVAQPAITAVGTAPHEIAVTPDGTHAYVTDNGATDVYPIDLATRTVGLPIALGAGHVPIGIAITPDGSKAYTSNFGPDSGGNGSGNTVTPIDLAMQTAGAAITVGGGPYGIAAAPDGRTVYVGNSNDDSFTPVDVATNTAATAIAGPLHTGARSLAITPDEAPVAVLNVTAPNRAVAFDAGASTVRYGTIASYAWDFGDGRGATTTTPTTSHTYDAGGTYTATVTETSSGGTSLHDVYTGQSLSRAGSPAARASAQVALSGGPVPALQLDASALAFGTVAVGTSSAKAVTVTNPGAADLHITSATVGGDFAATSGCGTVKPGATCAIGVTFNPSHDGDSAARLAIASDAGTSVVALSGTGASTGAVTGTVQDASLGPLADARVLLCTVALAGCRTASTDAHGRYRFDALQPGSYGATINPPSGSALAQGSRAATVTAGGTDDATTVLRRPTTLPAAVGLATANGKLGIDPLYWDDPFGVDVPLKPLGDRGPANQTVATAAFVSLTTAGTGQRVTGSAIAYAVHYDGSGKADDATEVDSPLMGTVKDGFRFQLGGLATNQRTVTSLPVSAVGAADRLGARSAGLQRLAHGPMQLSVYGLRGTAAPAAKTALFEEECAEDRKNLVEFRDTLLDYLQQLETQQQKIEAYQAAGNIVPAGAYAFEDDLRFHIEVVENSYANTADHLQYLCPPEPCEDDNIFASEVPCPATGPVAVDPSGYVKTRGGIPLAGAKVVLQRGDSAAGPYAALPNGDARMAPNNRRNPDRTDGDGHFGWDVFPGYYRVTATHAGCRGSATTKGLPVPPPVTSLLLRLTCPSLRRTASRLRIAKVTRRKTDVVVSLTARPRTGTVKVGGVLGFLAKGHVRITIPGHPKRITARYAGDARWAPSRAAAN